MPKKILFVCLGNICRSPAAESIKKHIVKEEGREDDLYIESEGIGTWDVGELADSRMERHGKGGEDG